VEHSIGFANPLALALLVLVAYVLWTSRRTLSGFSRLRQYFSTATRAAVVVLVVLALAEIQIVSENKNLCVMFALDASDSIPASALSDALAFVNDQAQNARASDLAGVVVFGKESEIEASPAERLALPKLQSIIEGQSTDLAGAIRLATACFPQGYSRRLVLVTDGNENRGNALDDAAYAKTNNVQIDVWPIEFDYTDEFLIDKLVIPEEVKENETFEAKVVVNSQNATPARLLLYQNDALIATSEVDLRPGTNVFTRELALGKSGFYRFDARIEKLSDSDDSIDANNSASAPTIVKGPPKVLCVAQDPSETRYLREALQSEKIDSDECRPEHLPTAVELQTYDAVVLSNVPAEAMTEQQFKLLEDYVDTLGGGLVVTGGDQSLSAGAYDATPLAKILPVEVDLKKKMILPNGALVLIMHTCEMPEANYWAVEIAMAAIKALSRRDEVGLVLYDPQLGGSGWLFLLQPATNKEEMIRLVQSMVPGDMPDFDPPMELALDELSQCDANLKHMIIISDGDPQRWSNSLLQEIIDAKITISTVCIAPHRPRDSDVMQELAQLAGGRFYNVQDPKKLPSIFIREARKVSFPPMREGDFQPRLVSSTQPVLGLTPDDIPMLKGYVVTERKPLAEVPLVSDKDEPILAHWRYGLGKVVAFTSDVKNRWAAHWIEWDKFVKFWTQTVRWAMRSVEKGGFHVTSNARGDHALIVVDSFNKDIDYLSSLALKATVITPNIDTLTVPLEQTAPGRYEARVPIESGGSYLASIAYAAGPGQSGLLFTGFNVPYSPEYRNLKTNRSLLKRLASMTGGHVVASEEYNAFLRDLTPTRSATPIWPLVLTIAVCLFLIDVAVRKLAVDFRKVAQKVWEFNKRFLWPFGVRKPAPATETHITRLRRTRSQLEERLQQEASVTEALEVAATREPEKLRTPAAAITEPPTEEKPKTAAASPKPPEEAEGESHVSKLLKAKKAAREKLESQRDADDFRGDNQ